MPCGVQIAPNPAGMGFDGWFNRRQGKNRRMENLEGIDGLLDIRRQAFLFIWKIFVGVAT